MGSKRTAHLRHTGMGVNPRDETILDWHTCCYLSVDKCRLGPWTQAPLLMYGSLGTDFAHLSRTRASKLGLLLPTDS